MSDRNRRPWNCSLCENRSFNLFTNTPLKFSALIEHVTFIHTNVYALIRIIFVRSFRNDVIHSWNVNVFHLILFPKNYSLLLSIVIERIWIAHKDSALSTFFNVELSFYLQSPTCSEAFQYLGCFNKAFYYNIPLKSFTIPSDTDQMGGRKKIYA